MTIFNFIPDITLSPRCNAIRILLNLPSIFLTKRLKNSSFHNLCTTKVNLPPSINSLLGLGLNFCPAPKSTTRLNQIDLNRFENDFRCRIHFTNGPELDTIDQLYVPNTEWKPPTPENFFIDSRSIAFANRINTLFKTPKKVRSNLLPTQEKALEWLLDHPELIVFNTDKNLGPAIIE